MESWYSTISDAPDVPLDTRKLLEKASGTLVARARCMDFDGFVSAALVLIQQHLSAIRSIQQREGGNCKLHQKD